MQFNKTATKKLHAAAGLRRACGAAPSLLRLLRLLQDKAKCYMLCVGVGHAEPRGDWRGALKENRDPVESVHPVVVVGA